MIAQDFEIQSPWQSIVFDIRLVYIQGFLVKFDQDQRQIVMR